MVGLLLGRLRLTTHTYRSRSNLTSTTSRNYDHTSNWNSSISSWTSNFKIKSSSFSFDAEPVGFFTARVLAEVPTFLLVALDGGRETTPLLVVDELFTVVFCFCTSDSGFMGLTCDVAALETTCFLGEIAFAVALDLTGRAVTTGFVTVMEREVVARRVAVVLVAVVAVLIVVVNRAGRVVEAGATVFRVPIAASFREGALTGRVIVTGIFEGAALDFGVGFSFDLEVDGSRNRSSPSSSDEGTKVKRG